MDEGSDSDYSDSSGSISSTNSSSSSSDRSIDDSTELAKIGKYTLKLPKGLCENADIFREFFSMDVWKSLPDNFQAYLKNKFLPHFSESNEIEQERTLQMLFNNEITRFHTSPLIDLQRNLDEGSYRPDVLKLRQRISKAKRREQRFQECERISQLAKTLMISRERLLRSAYDAPPGIALNVDRIINSTPKMSSTGAAVRAKKRYFEEISNIASQVGASELSDDDFQDKDAMTPFRCTAVIQTTPSNEAKIFGTMCRRNGTNSALSMGNPVMTLNDGTLKQVLVTHKKRKLEEPERPEFDTTDIRLRDVHARAQIATGYRRLGPGRPLGRKSYMKLKQQQQQQQQDQIDGSGGVSKTQDNNIPVNLTGIQNLQQPAAVGAPNQLGAPTQFTTTTAAGGQQTPISNDNTNSESEDDISVNVDVVANISTAPPPPPPPPHITGAVQDDNIKKRQQIHQGGKGNKRIMLNVNGTTLPENMPNVAAQKDIKEKHPETLSLSHYHGKFKAATLSDLEGIDMMHLPVDLDDSGQIDLLNDLKSESSEAPPAGPELMQETHACFLSLIRDIFCSTANHRIKLEDLKAKICTWLSNPITALNDWYCQADNWLTLIPSAVHFLVGEFVDQPEDFVPYVEYKTQLNIYQWIGAGRDSDQHLVQLCNYWLARRNDMGNKPSQKFDLGSQKSIDYDEALLEERPISPPPPRCPTNWIVQAAKPEEIEEFRLQERQRFENPHKAFTYRQHGYESVVGPVKGIYTQILALTKARGHNMLIADRPNFVTILTLVRDATARLPNGEGTRADICELLKSSQYINTEAQDNVLQTIVSGALDRMHTEHDPCVRYDTKRKIWIYLHRNRTEEEFERLHQQFQGVGKHKKATNRKVKPKTGKVTQSTPLITENATPIPSIVAASNPANITTVPKSIPALSTIQPNQPVTVQATSIMTPVGTAATPLKISPQKSLVKSELIQLNPQEFVEKLEVNEIDTTIDTSNAIVLQQQKTQPSNVPTLENFIVDNKIQKIITTKKTLSSPALSPANTTPVKVSTPSGIQTVHVSAAIPVSGINSDAIAGGGGVVKQVTASIQPTLTATVAAASQASVIGTGNQSVTPQNQIVVGNKKITKPILINQNQSSSLIQQVGTSGQGYIIPVNINNSDQLKALPSIPSTLISTSNLSPKIIKANQASTLTNTINNRPTIVQQSGKNFVRVATSTAQAGKSLISPHVAATNISLQQQQKLLGNTNTPNIQLQQKLGGTGVVTNVRAQVQKGVSLINNATVKGQTQLTTMQQKQILQNIISHQQQQHQQQQQQQQQQQKQRTNAINMGQNAVIIPSGTITGQQAAGIQTKNVIIPSPQGNVQQIQKIVNVSSTGLNTVAVSVVAATGGTNTGTNTAHTVVTSQQPGTSLINPQIIQIQGAGGTKLQTINTANLSPQQQQNLLQSIKQQQMKLQQTQAGSQQQSLIIKQQPTIFQQIQKQQSHGGGGTPTTISVSLGTGSKTVTSMMGAANVTNLIATNPQSLAGANVIQHQSQNIIKHQTIVQQSPTALGKQINLAGTQQQTITRVIKSAGGTGSIVQPQVITTVAGVRTQTGNPVMAKVLTNSSGQIISLESLLQKQGMAPGTTIRVAGAKPSQTNLIQLAGAPNSQITQYAVVSQGRNLISVGTPQRLVTTQASNTNTIVTSLSGGNINKVVGTEQKNTIVAGLNSPNVQQSQQLQQQQQNQPKLITANQIQPLTAQQIVNAKVLGKAGTAGIRMVNASNLNIAHIRGKPVIIASKPANVTTQQAGQNVILQNPGNSTNLVIGNQTLKVQGNVMSPTNVQVLNQATSSQPQTVVLGNQILKVQQAPTTIRSQTSSATNIIGNNLGNVNNNTCGNIGSVSSTNTGTMVVNSNSALNQNATKTVVLSSTGQAIRVQSPAQVQVQTGSGSTQNPIVLGTAVKGTAIKTANPGQQRVVLAVQGGGQILLPPGFQGGAINLKSLQGLKVVSIAQQQQQQQQQQHQQSQQQQQQQQTQNKGQTDEQQCPMFAQIFTAAQQAPHPPNPGVD